MRSEKYDVTIFERRLRRLEISMRRWRACSIALVVLMIAALAAAAAPRVQDVVRCKRLEVVNGEGRALVTIEADKNGGKIDLLTESGKPGVVADCNWDKTGGAVTVYSTSDFVQGWVGLRGSSFGSTEIEFIDTDLRPKDRKPIRRLWLTSGARAGMIQVLDAKEKAIVQMSADPARKPLIIFDDEKPAFVAP